MVSHVQVQSGSAVISNENHSKRLPLAVTFAGSCWWSVVKNKVLHVRRIPGSVVRKSVIKLFGQTRFSQTKTNRAQKSNHVIATISLLCVRACASDRVNSWRLRFSETHAQVVQSKIRLAEHYKRRKCWLYNCFKLLNQVYQWTFYVLLESLFPMNLFDFCS